MITVFNQTSSKNTKKEIDSNDTRNMNTFFELLKEGNEDTKAVYFKKEDDEKWVVIQPFNIQNLFMTFEYLKTNP